jgi:hypothetical protein
MPETGTIGNGVVVVSIEESDRVEFASRINPTCNLLILRAALTGNRREAS